jgi:hypothetical protein
MQPRYVKVAVNVPIVQNHVRKLTGIHPMVNIINTGAIYHMERRI